MASEAAVTSSASANCGMFLGGTNEQTSMSRTPAASSASIQAILAGVGKKVGMIWSPSRSPTSRTIALSVAMGFSSGSGRTAQRPV